MVLMEVNGVFSSNSQSSYPQVVLKEAEGDCYLHIVIGCFEAAAISMAHGKQQPARPISYDLAQQILVGVDARVVRIEITDLHKSTYYAEVHLVDDEGKTHVLDARPSDAIALALRFNAPIYAAPEILEEAGHARPEEIEPLAEAEAIAEIADRASRRDAAPPIAVSQERRAIITAAVDQLEQLKRRMRQAIAEEVYEEAARLRDEISRLEEE
jgi:bifunctional DNase/RNase